MPATAGSRLPPPCHLLSAVRSLRFQSLIRRPLIQPEGIIRKLTQRDNESIYLLADPFMRIDSEIRGRINLNVMLTGRRGNNR